jgi:hypothetical protein
MPASPQQLHELLTWCIDFGRTMLAGSGEFYPFGATLDANGKVVAQGGWDGNEHPNPTDIYRLLAQAFASGVREGSVTASALAVNVNIPSQAEAPSPDGLRVHLETEGYSRFIYMPYTIAQRGFFKRSREVTFAEPIAVEVAPAVYPRSADA